MKDFVTHEIKLKNKKKTAFDFEHSLNIIFFLFYLEIHSYFILNLIRLTFKFKLGKLQFHTETTARMLHLILKKGKILNVGNSEIT